MINRNPVTLTPLQIAHHVDSLQNVYEQTPAYWQMYELLSVSPGQARRDMEEASDIPGRHMMGIVQRLERTNPLAGAQLIGLVDFRLNWPDENQAYLGMIMVAGPYQRQGVGRKAWRLLMNWLRKETDTEVVRLGVEQFNAEALKFFQTIGFQMTGEANRIRSGERFVRLLYMENQIRNEAIHYPSR